MPSSSPVPPSVFSALIHCLHCLMEEILHHCRTQGEPRLSHPRLLPFQDTQMRASARQVGADVSHRDADSGCPSLCHLGAFCQIHSTTRALNPLARLPVLQHSLPSLPPPSVFFSSQGKAFVPGWWGSWGCSSKNKYILASNICFWKEEWWGGGETQRGGCGQKNSPLRECLEKEQGNIFWLWWWLLGCISTSLPPSPLSLTHTQPHVPSGPLLLIEAWFGVPAPADLSPRVDTRLSHHSWVHCKNWGLKKG